MSVPLVSVAMVVCNAQHFLAEAIESILGQTFNDFEFIIVDFGSRDNSRSVISSYAAKDKRIKVHQIAKCNLPEARNAACSQTQGRYIAVMDADDVSLPKRLEWEVEFMENYLEVGLLGGAVQWISARGEPLHILDFPRQASEIKAALLVKFPFCHPTFLLRRQAFEFVGGYRPAFAVTHDYDLAIRISEHFQCANLEQVVLKYRVHPHQVSFSKRKLQTLSVLAAQASASLRRNGRIDMLNAVEHITPELLIALGIPQVEQQTALANDYLVWIRNICRAGEHSVALKALLEVLLSSELERAAARQIADLWIVAAALHWNQRELLKSLLDLAHAVVARPAVIGRPAKRFVQ